MSNLTKKALKESLKGLLIKKPLNKITIAELTDDCELNRMTFYYHFKDIYDLVEWSLQEEAKAIVGAKKTYATWQEGFLDVFKETQKNEILMTNIYNHLSREKIEEYFNTITFSFVYPVIEEKYKKDNLSKKEKIFITNFYKFAFVGIILDWMENDMEEDPNEIIKKTNNIINGNNQT